MEQNIVIDLMGDILFVNEIPFLVNLGKRIKFTTVENLKDWKAETIMSGLKSVINLYKIKFSPLKICLWIMSLRSLIPPSK